MMRFSPFYLLAAFLSAGIACLPLTVAALEQPGTELQEVGIAEQLGASVDPEIPLVDEAGNSRPLREYLAGGKPAILIPVYFSCPRMCGLVLSGAVGLLNELKLGLGADYRVLAVSFDPEEGPELASKRRTEYLAQLRTAPNDPGAWRFLTGKEADVSRLMQQVGFKYKRDGGEYAHSAAIIVLTPGGKISQYFTGIEYSAWDVRLSLIDASQGAIGSAIDHVLLFCFRFDPTKGKYTLAAMNVMKLGGMLTMIALGTVIFFSARKLS